MSPSKQDFLAVSTRVVEQLFATPCADPTPQESIEYLARGLMAVAPLLASESPDDADPLMCVDVISANFCDTKLYTEDYNQASCEACTLCIVFDLLDWKPPERFIVWLEKLLRYPLVDNNWQWFGAIISAYVQKHGGKADFIPYLKRIDSFYVDRGWYLDGNKYDMYSGWVMQFMPHFFSRMVPYMAEYYLRGHKEFLQDWACLFDKQGRNTQWGRSQIYKYAASNPFVACWFNPAFESDHTYSNLVWSNIASYPDPMLAGAYAPGDCVVDSYSCKYSPLWSSGTLLAGLLPEDSKFFTGKQVEGWWNHEVHVERAAYPKLHIAKGRPNNQYIHFGRHVEPNHPNLDTRYLFNDR